ncbi:hypothetical protein JX266_012769 [Neoarthrinium moseri]|nr:hypothetical protein JX266_012769 [Neoarthrinium moseri]
MWPGVLGIHITTVRIGALMSRAEMADLLLNQCARLGIRISWNTHIVDFDEDVSAGKGVAVGADGRRYEADVVVAADGLGSRSLRLTIGENVRAVSTGYVIYRGSVSTKDLENATVLKEYLQQNPRPEIRLSTGHNIHIVLTMYQRGVAFAITLPDNQRGTAMESWSSTVPVEQLLQSIPDGDKLDPLVLDLLNHLPERGVIEWKLCMRNPQAKWTSQGGHVVQVGDSAHSFIPTSGSGATMALEDSLSLAECLRLGGKNDIPSGNKVHELLRMQRVTLLQRLGIVVCSLLHSEDLESIKRAPKNMTQGKWLWSHRADAYATANYQKAKEHLEGKSTFENTNLPPGHVPEQWTLEGEVEREKQGRTVDLRANGDWSIN